MAKDIIEVLNEFVYGINSLHPKEIKDITIELSIDDTVRISHEICKRISTIYNPTNCITSSYDFTVNIMGCNIKIIAKEYRDRLILDSVNKTLKDI